MTNPHDYDLATDKDGLIIMHGVTYRPEGFHLMPDREPVWHPPLYRMALQAYAFLIGVDPRALALPPIRLGVQRVLAETIAGARTT